MRSAMAVRIDKSIKSSIFGSLVENEDLTMIGGTGRGESAKEQSDLRRRFFKAAGIKAN
ncbi:hypothetical protein [Undibacter mobilis]|uniref:hypothetical protein n=1 Tax=Undibacter mobilis TaxID=2292256 RepID=UPI00143DA132|nr:hypothetical protein [Undibacter mobilis]